MKFLTFLFTLTLLPLLLPLSSLAEISFKGMIITPSEKEEDWQKWGGVPDGDSLDNEKTRIELEKLGFYRFIIDQNANGKEPLPIQAPSSSNEVPKEPKELLIVSGGHSSISSIWIAGLGSDFFNKVSEKIYSAQWKFKLIFQETCENAYVMTFLRKNLTENGLIIGQLISAQARGTEEIKEGLTQDPNSKSFSHLYKGLIKASKENAFEKIENIFEVIQSSNEQPLACQQENFLKRLEDLLKTKKGLDQDQIAFYVNLFKSILDNQKIMSVIYDEKQDLKKSFYVKNQEDSFVFDTKGKEKLTQVLSRWMNSCEKSRKEKGLFCQDSTHERLKNLLQILKDSSSSNELRINRTLIENVFEYENNPIRKYKAEIQEFSKYFDNFSPFVIFSPSEKKLYYSSWFNSILGECFRSYTAGWMPEYGTDSIKNFKEAYKKDLDPQINQTQFEAIDDLNHFIKSKLKNL